MQRSVILSIALVALTLAGCPSNRGTPSVTAQPAPQPAEIAPEPATPAEAAPAEMVRERADVGSGKKGRGYGEGIVVTPIKTYFAAQEMIAFMIEVPRHLQTYQTLHDGRGPATHEEFMKEIIEANQVQLPELPAGHRYVFDPEKQELMVEHPK